MQYYIEAFGICKKFDTFKEAYDSAINWLRKDEYANENNWLVLLCVSYSNCIPYDEKNLELLCEQDKKIRLMICNKDTGARGRCIWICEKIDYEKNLNKTKKELEVIMEQFK